MVVPVPLGQVLVGVQLFGRATSPFQNGRGIS